MRGSARPPQQLAAKHLAYGDHEECAECPEVVVGVIMSALPRGSSRGSDGNGGDSEAALASAQEPLLPRAAAAASGMHPPGGPGAGVA
eukprot:COSAG01_NODE_33012_length_571_cov_1.480932_1_plen_87_part_10